MADSLGPILRDVKFKAASVRPPVGPISRVPSELRDTAVKSILSRVSREFEEMPGLTLTLAQASRLFGLQLDVCAGVLVRLIDQGLLRLRSDGRYALRREAA